MSDDPVARFERAYWRAFRELDSVRLRQWEEYRLTLPQLRVLYHIRRAPGVTGGELAAALGITVSTVSGLVGKLAERGLIARGTAPDDRRQAPLELTEEGRALVGTLSEVGRGFTGQIAASLGDELAAVTDALEKLAQASERAHSQPQEGDETPAPAPRRRREFFPGVVTAALPDFAFAVTLEDGREVQSTLSANLRLRFTRVAVGDRVVIEFSSYDQSRSRIDSILR